MAGYTLQYKQIQGTETCEITGITLVDGFNGKVEIPSSIMGETKELRVTSIAGKAFWAQTEITEMSLPNGIKSIGNSAFASASNLTSINIPNSVTKIDGWAFSGCKALSSIEIPNSVITVGTYAFEKCTNLKKVIVPSSLQTINDYTFSECTNLSAVCCNGTDSDWPKTIGTSNEYFINAPRYYSYNANLSTDGIEYGIIEDKQTACVSGYNSSETKANIVIANKFNDKIVTTIKENAFADKNNILSIKTPNTLITIEKSAIKNCSILSSIEIGSGVSNIASPFLESCGKLSKIIVSKNNNDYVSEKDVILYKKDSNHNKSILIRTAPKISSATLNVPNSVTSIALYACAGCNEIKNIIHKGAKLDLGWGAF